MNLTLLLFLFSTVTLTKSSENEDSDTSSSATSTSTEFSVESNAKAAAAADNFYNSSAGREHPSFEIFLPYRLDYLAEMKLTTIFPRKFLYTLRNYEQSKSSGVPVLSMPNCSSGAMRLASVELPSRTDMNSFLSMMEELSRRVYRTGLNKTTAGGNFRLPIKGLTIDPDTLVVYTKVDIDFPTDSHSRYVKFMKSLYYRLAKSNLPYQINENVRLDQIVLGMVNKLEDIDLKAFEKTFRNFQIGFLTIGKIIVRPPGEGGDRYKSIFYFDHNSYEPIIGIENTVEGEENQLMNGAVRAAGATAAGGKNSGEGKKKGKKAGEKGKSKKK